VGHSSESRSASFVKYLEGMISKEASSKKEDDREDSPEDSSINMLKEGYIASRDR
jgi:hypothetical protein